MHTMYTYNSYVLCKQCVSGIGNWVADEVLYQSRIHLSTPADKLSPEQVSKLVEAITYVLGTAVALDARNEDFPKDWLFHYRYTAVYVYTCGV